LLNYSVPNSPCNETFSCFFNFSDIAGIPGIVINHGVQDWNITLSNTTVESWQNIQTWNITLSNSSVSWSIIFDWNITLSNSTGYTEILNWNITISNSTPAQIITEWNITLSNTSGDIVISAPFPENDSYINDLQPTLVFTLMNPDGAMNYSIFVGNSSSNCTTLLTNESGVLDGTFHYNNYYLANSYNTGWWWAVNASDDDSYTNNSFLFTPVRGGAGGIVSTGGGLGLAVGAGIGLFGLLALVLVLSRRRKNNGYM